MTAVHPTVVIHNCEQIVDVDLVRSRKSHVRLHVEPVKWEMDVVLHFENFIRGKFEPLQVKDKSDRQILHCKTL